MDTCVAQQGLETACVVERHNFRSTSHLITTYVRQLRSVSCGIRVGAIRRGESQAQGLGLGDDTDAVENWVQLS